MSGDEGAKVEGEKEEVKGERKECSKEVHLHPRLIRRAYLPQYKVARALVFIDGTKSIRTYRYLNFKGRGDLFVNLNLMTSRIFQYSTT